MTKQVDVQIAFLHGKIHEEDMETKSSQNALESKIFTKQVRYGIFKYLIIYTFIIVYVDSVLV